MMRQRRTGLPPRRIIAATLLALGLGSPAHAAPPDGPLSPADAPKSFHLEPGLKLELIAAEPLVVSPVAAAFDERGRMFVAENRDYPTGPAEGKEPDGRVAILEDTDGDGRMDRRTDFATGLSFPNGLMPWKGGLILTCSPDVLYLRDTDGDGKADERKVLFTGFSTAGSTQLRVSHPTLSPDNWIYLTSGLTGGSVVNPSAPDRPPVPLGRTDFRFRPEGDAWEAADGGSQFGMTFDDAGNRFICYNRIQVQHAVLESATLRRNPHLAASDTVQDCPAERVEDPATHQAAAARLFPLSRNTVTFDSHAGTFTAACGVTVWKGTGLPPEYLGGVFSCDPTGNLVHFDKLEPRGATFAARPARDGVEFLASTDSWFRPDFLAGGPDGALYICDMYRRTIEHPDYLPEEIRKRTDFSGGKGMGRLWRVTRADADPADLARLRRPDLAALSTAQLCDVLRDPDGWHRTTAHRLLLERRDPACLAPLKALAADPKAPAASVVIALHFLATLDALPDDLLAQALKSAAAPVRENALILADARIAGDASWLPRILPLADDPDPRVRFRAAIVLGDTPPDAADVPAALARIAARDGADRWARAAVFSSLAGREKAFLAGLRAIPSGSNPLPPEMLNELGRLLGASLPRPEWPGLIDLIVSSKPGFAPGAQAALITGLGEAARGQIPPGEQADVLTAALGPAADHPEAAASVRALVAAMMAAALDPAQPPGRRTAAVGLLGLGHYGQIGETLLKLLDPDQPPDLRVAAVRALGRLRDAQVAPTLLEPARFAAYPPTLRAEVLAALVEQPAHQPGLLAAVEAGAVPVGAIGTLARQQILQNPDEAIRKRASALFGAVAGDRAKVYDDYKSVVALPSDPSHGRAVFRRECASCHRLDREGSAVGPDLSSIRNQPKEAILLHVLVPDQEITQGYAAYTVATKDGRVLTGLVGSETPTSLTLRQPLGKEDTILRGDIDELSAGKNSLMPQGLEKTITRQEFADLLAYLRGEEPQTQEGPR